MPQLRQPAQIIEEQLRALRALQKLARQPCVVEAIRLLARELPGPPAAAERSVARRGAILDTGITKAMDKVLPSIRGEFSYTDVVSRLEEDGYEFAAVNPRMAVGRVLRRLVTRRKIIQVRRGTAGEPSVYRLIA